jgi:hypothetical protein
MMLLYNVIALYYKYEIKNIIFLLCSRNEIFTATMHTKMLCNIKCNLKCVDLYPFHIYKA